MNDFIGNNNDQTEEQLKAKKMMKIIGIILAVLIVICIGLFILMYYIQAKQLKITLDGKQANNLQNILIIEENEVYVPIRQFAQYVGYDSYSGDYKQYAEDNTKCYVQCENEIASFSLNSDKIYKLLLTGTDYEYFTINEPVKMINGVLYTTMEGASTAFNLSFSYNKEQNQISIYTLPYLVTFYAGQFKNSAITGDNVNFSNQKAILYNRIIVKNADNAYGVYSLDGKEILGTKYQSIKFIESTKEFIVTTAEKKMGIMAHDATTKISPEYDDIKQIDKDTGLYLVTNNKKQGVINNSGSIVVYLEYDQIGIDSTKYSSNDIKNQYLLYGTCIPVKRNNLWGLFNKNGREIATVQYQELGCLAGNNSSTDKTNTNNILLVPEYNGIVVKKGELYGLIDSTGKELLPNVLKSIYSTTSAGEETYYMIYNEQIMNLITYIKTYVIKEENTNTITNEQTNNTINNQNNNTITNGTTNNTANNNQANTTTNGNVTQTNNTVSPNSNTPV